MASLGSYERTCESADQFRQSFGGKGLKRLTFLFQEVRDGGIVHG